jgi:hypothetical protein
MDDNCRALADAIGRRVVDRDFEGLRDLCVPWLKDRVSAIGLARMIDDAAGLPAAKTWTVDKSPVDLASLRKPDGCGPPTSAFDAEITDDNYRGWICVQFQPDPGNEEGFNVCFDLWFAAVEDDGECRIGYIEAAEPG